MADAVQTFGQHVHEEPPDKLMRRQRHGGVAARPLHPVVLDLKGDAAGIGADQPAVGDGDAVGIAGEIGQHRLWSGEGRLAVDEPPPAPQRAEVPHEGAPLGEAGLAAVEGELACRMGRGQLLQHKPAKQRR